MVTPAVALSTALLAGGSYALSKAGGTPSTPNIPAPPGLVAAQTPNAKPKTQGQQQSFLSATASAQQQPQSQQTGKTLIGA